MLHGNHLFQTHETAELSDLHTPRFNRDWSTNNHVCDVIHDGEPVRGRLRRVRSGFRYLWRSLRSHSPHRDGASPSPSPDPPPRALRSGLWLSPSLLSIICE